MRSTVIFLICMLWIISFHSEEFLGVSRLVLKVSRVWCDRHQYPNGLNYCVIVLTSRLWEQDHGILLDRIFVGRVFLLQGSHSTFFKNLVLQRADIFLFLTLLLILSFAVLSSLTMLIFMRRILLNFLVVEVQESLCLAYFWNEFCYSTRRG